MGPLEAMKTWDDMAIAGCNRFIKKVFSFIHLAKDSLIAEDQEEDTVIKARHLAIKKVTESLDGVRFNTAISSLMELLNSISGKSVSKGTVNTLLVMLSPLAPHLAEELWELMGNKDSIAYQVWPNYDEALLKNEVVNVVVQINGKKRSLLELPVSIDDASLKNNVISHMANSAYVVSDADKFITVRDKASGAPKLVNVISK